MPIPLRRTYRRKTNLLNIQLSPDGKARVVPGPAKPPRKPPRHWESELQCGLVRWFLLNVRPEAAKLISIPNGDLRDPRVVERLKEEGQCAGATDMLLILPAARVVWVELKLEADRLWGVRRTDLSDDQQVFHRWLEHFGHDKAVVRSPEEFCDLLDRFGVAYRARPLRRLLPSPVRTPRPG